MKYARIPEYRFPNFVVDLNGSEVESTLSEFGTVLKEGEYSAYFDKDGERVPGVITVNGSSAVFRHSPR